MSILSWRLWQALKYPPEAHPLYRHALDSYKHTVSIPIQKAKRGDHPSDEFPFGSETRSKRIVVSQPSNTARSTLFKILASSSLLGLCCCSGGFFFSLPAMLLLVLTGTLYGAYTAVRVSGDIAEEHDQGRYELLSLTPSGPLSYSWSAMMAYLYRNTIYSSLRRWMPRICIGLALLALASLPFQVMVYVNSPAYRNEYVPQGDFAQLLGLISSFAMVLGFYADFYQSVIAGILIAVVTPTYRRNRFETQALTLGGFLGVQLATYLVALLVGFAILPGIYRGLNINGWFGEITLIVLRLGTFLLVREVLIIWLWQFAQQRLNIGVREAEELLPKPKRETA